MRNVGGWLPLSLGVFICFYLHFYMQNVGGWFTFKGEICTSPKGGVAWGHVMGLWRSPSTYPMFNGKFNLMGGRINAPDLSSSP
jgi:hypothetical protein